MTKKWQKKCQTKWQKMTMKCKTKWQKNDSAKQKWQTNAKPNDKKKARKRQKINIQQPSEFAGKFFISQGLWEEKTQLHGEEGVYFKMEQSILQNHQDKIWRCRKQNLQIGGSEKTVFEARNVESIRNHL